jgi:outer membrane protein OmpA-like peptidoglycan-associated protein
VNKGVNPSQLATKTFSEDIPIATNRTVQGRAFNRRVELYFIDENNNRVDY